MRTTGTVSERGGCHYQANGRPCCVVTVTTSTTLLQPDLQRRRPAFDCSSAATGQQQWSTALEIPCCTFFFPRTADWRLHVCCSIEY